MEDNFQKAVEHLTILMNIDLNDVRQKMVLATAINYADLSIYTTEIKTKEDDVNNEIFVVKAQSYFRRAMLHPFNDREQISNIRQYEHNTIMGLRMQLPPKCFRW
jgi:hypothetical protein